MKTKTVAAVAVLVALIAATPAAAHVVSWFSQRTILLWSSPLVDHEGAAIPDILVHYIGDGENRATCVMVIQNTATGQITATAVDRASCGERP